MRHLPLNKFSQSAEIYDPENNNFRVYLDRDCSSAKPSKPDKANNFVKNRLRSHIYI